MMCGGSSAVQDATPEVQTMCDELKPNVEGLAEKKFDVFTAKSFMTQVVAGTNFFIKVHVGGDDYVHMRVHKPLPHTAEKISLHGIKACKAHHDALAYF
ncbi:hypothetical protein AAFF_G00102150 [Aldrovandia affinis]|uniref:Cystatin-B n=1 Tax=Aldrovandia affinis TaxID=143900 RepID=A0AAD7RUI0_9TELE|nr:hypothetical protein AAFF_G00102150 [Aldrovandia affinis]